MSAPFIKKLLHSMNDSIRFPGKGAVIEELTVHWIQFCKKLFRFFFNLFYLFTSLYVLYGRFKFLFLVNMFENTSHYYIR